MSAATIKPVILMLTCGNSEEADLIVSKLLERRLIVCANQTSVSSTNYWKGTVENNDEILLIMKSDESLYEEIETEVRRHHSYETFALEALPVLRTTAGVLEWMREGLDL